MRIISPRPQPKPAQPGKTLGTLVIKIGPLRYARVGFVSIFSIGRLVIYERIGDIRSLAPYLKPKGA